MENFISKGFQENNCPKILVLM